MARTPRTKMGLLAATLLLLPALVVGSTGCANAGKANSGSGASLLDEIKSRGVLRVGSRVDNPPHSSYDKQGKWVGFDNDIAAAIAKRWGVELEMVKVDELTRISFLQNGKVDLSVASISKTRKRGAQVDFSQTYFYSVQTFVVRKNTAKSYQDLVGKRVGASRGSSSIGNWKAWLKRNGVSGEPQVEEFGDKRAALLAVKQGAIAGWTEDYEVLASYARNEPDVAVLQVPGGTGVKLDGIAMRKNDSPLRDAVNLAL